MWEQTAAVVNAPPVSGCFFIFVLALASERVHRAASSCLYPEIGNWFISTVKIPVDLRSSFRESEVLETSVVRSLYNEGLVIHVLGQSTGTRGMSESIPCYNL